LTNRIRALAKSAALKSKSKYRVGCVIYSGSKVLAIGTNDMTKTSPKSWHPFQSRHAEFNAILKVKRRDLPGCSIYVHRIGRDGLTHNAKPCPHCQDMILWAGLKRVSWSEDKA